VSVSYSRSLYHQRKERGNSRERFWVT